MTCSPKPTHRWLRSSGICGCRCGRSVRAPIRHSEALPCRCRAGRTISRRGATCRSAMPRITCRSPDHAHKALSYRAASVGRAVMVCLVPQSRYLGVLFRFNFEAFLHGMPYRLMHAFGVERGVYHPATRGPGFCDSKKSLAHSLVHGAVHLFVAAYSVGA